MIYPLRVVWLGLLLGWGSLPAQTAAEMELQVEAAVALAEAEPPELPTELKVAFGTQRVRLRLVVDETGRVAKARLLDGADPRLEAPLLAAVNRWTFRPALSAGRPVPAGIEVEMPLVWPAVQPKGRGVLPPLPPVLIESSPLIQPQPRRTPPGGYPELLTRRQIGGEVVFRGVVTTEGRVRDSGVLSATHPDFVHPALAALAQWEFTPAMQGDLPVEAATEGVVSFERIGATRAAVLAANQLTAPDGGPPLAEPEPVTLLDPVRPFDELMLGEAGSATAEFTVSTRGQVQDMAIIEATAPAYGQALLASLRHAQFMPAISGGTSTVARLRLRVEFPAVPAGAGSPADGWLRVLHALRANEIGGAQGLDEKLTPIFRVRALYPLELLDTDPLPGEAQVEVVIDRRGRVQLPRVVTASHDAFGWAAATAVSGWVFKVPRRNGEPVDVRVRIPFRFTPPEL